MSGQYQLRPAKWAIVGLAALALAACDPTKSPFWPFAKNEEQATTRPAGGPPPPPPMEPVDPLEPIPVSGPAETPVVENPNANVGAPSEGTPFIEQPEAPPPAGADPTPVRTDTGQPVTPAGPSGPSESPDPSPAPASGGNTPAPNPTPGTPDPTPAPNPAPNAASEPAPTGPPAPTPNFFFYSPGSLEPASGTGSADKTILAPDMVFPIRVAPSYPQSQVYRFGGGVRGGDQCDARNFTAPWRDNFCEKRTTTNKTPFCTATGVHLGQDIRVGTPEGCRAERAAKAADRMRYEVVAVEDGVISNVGSYSVTLRAGGRIYRYLHLNMAKLKVATGQPVKKGDVIGYVSNDFGGTPTTLHLHFELKLNTAESGWQFAPPYASLLAAYQRRENNPGGEVTDAPASGG